MLTKRQIREFCGKYYTSYRVAKKDLMKLHRLGYGTNIKLGSDGLRGVKVVTEWF